MEISVDGMIPAEHNIPKEAIMVRTVNNETDLNPSKENIESLKAIQKIILAYENKYLSLDEVLTMLLEFYGEIVPYK